MTNRKLIKQWVNQKNSFEYTPLHYAAQRGNLKIVQILEKYQAIDSIKSTNGQTVLHKAAQGDSPLMISYYIEKGFDIDVMDQDGFTPLHSAAVSGSQNAVSFLLIQGADINKQTSNSRKTALHLAVKYGYTKIVRKLLIKGIDRYIQDISGKSALQIAIDENQQEIECMIRDKVDIKQVFNIKKPNRPRVRQEKEMLIFVSLYLTSLVMTILFTFPYVQNTTWMMVFIFFSCQTIGYFIFSWIVNPGYVNKDTTQSILELLKSNEYKDICAECVIVRPYRSHHCYICQQCIMGYDHHCIWINNCVGQRNHWIFYFFILSLFIELICQLVIQSQRKSYYLIYIDQNLYNKIKDLSSKIVHTVIIPFLNDEILHFAKYITFAYVIINCCLFFIPISLVLWIQTKNILKDQNNIDGIDKQLDCKQRSEQQLNEIKVEQQCVDNQENDLTMASIQENEQQVHQIFKNQFSSSAWCIFKWCLFKKNDHPGELYEQFQITNN